MARLPLRLEMSSRCQQTGDLFRNSLGNSEAGHWRLVSLWVAVQQWHFWWGLNQAIGYFLGIQTRLARREYWTWCNHLPSENSRKIAPQKDIFFFCQIGRDSSASFLVMPWSCPCRTKAAVREPLLARFPAQLGTSQAVAADLVPWQRSPQRLLSMMKIFWLVSICLYHSLSFPPPMPWFLSCDLPILLIWISTAWRWCSNVGCLQGFVGHSWSGGCQFYSYSCLRMYVNLSLSL